MICNAGQRRNTTMPHALDWWRQHDTRPIAEAPVRLLRHHYDRKHPSTHAAWDTRNTTMCAGLTGPLNNPELLLSVSQSLIMPELLVTALTRVLCWKHH